MAQETAHPDPTRRVWAFFRKDPLVLAVSDAEVVLVELPFGAAPDWLPARSGLLPPEEGRLSVERVCRAGRLRVRIPRNQLRFVEISGSVLMLQGQTDIPYVLEEYEEPAAREVVKRLSTGRPRYAAADVAKDVGNWNLGMAAMGLMGVVVPSLFDASWGVVMLLAAALGFLIRRPVCYLVYAVLCFGGATSIAAANLRAGPGAWVLAALVVAFLGLVTLRRWIHLRRVRTRAPGREGPGEVWFATAGAVLVLIGAALALFARLAPGRLEGLRPRFLSESVDLAVLAVGLSGHLALLALGLALGGTSAAGARLVRRLRGPVFLVAMVLFVHLLASRYTGAVGVPGGGSGEEAAPLTFRKVATASRPATRPGAPAETRSRPTPPTRPGYPRSRRRPAPATRPGAAPR